MAIVRYVAFYPPTGFPDRRWQEDPACDALVKSGRRVSEALSREVAKLGLDGKASEVRVFVRPAPQGRDDVDVDVHLDFVEGFETATALVPSAVAGLAAQDRAEVALDILLSSLRVLAPHRAWDLDALDRAEAGVREARLEFVWHSPWKASPSRRQEARATFWIEDHGYGRAVLEVRDRGDDRAVPSRSNVAVAFCTSAGFERSAKTLRWHGERVTMESEMGLLGSQGGPLIFQPGSGSGDAAWAPPSSPDGTGLRPHVMATGSTHVPDEHRIRFVGGGPTNGVPRMYSRKLSAHFKEVSDAGANWWRASDRKLLEISYNITVGAEPKVVVRRLKDRVTARIYRPVDTFSLTNGASLAREDVDAVVHAVTERLGLSDPPAL